MADGRREEKENEHYCCSNRRIVMVQLEARFCLLVRHLIKLLSKLEACDESEDGNDVSEQKIMERVCVTRQQ